MPIKLVNGSEPTIAEAVAWLERRGIQPREIRRIEIDAEVGRPLMIKATFFVSDPSEVSAPAASDVVVSPTCGIAGHPSGSHACRVRGVPIAWPDPVARHPVAETEAVPDAKQE